MEEEIHITDMNFSQLANGRLLDDPQVANLFMSRIDNLDRALRTIDIEQLAEEQKQTIRAINEIANDYWSLKSTGFETLDAYATLAREGYLDKLAQIIGAQLTNEIYERRHTDEEVREELALKAQMMSNWENFFRSTKTNPYKWQGNLPQSISWDADINYGLKKGGENE